MPKVRTRMQPDVEIDVPEEEAAVLAACGLLAEEPKPVQAPPPAMPATPKAKPAGQPPAAKPEPATPDATNDAAGATTTTTKTKG
jgi:hypothetical protein